MFPRAGKEEILRGIFQTSRAGGWGGGKPLIVLEGRSKEKEGRGCGLMSSSFPHKKQDLPTKKPEKCGIRRCLEA